MILFNKSRLSKNTHEKYRFSFWEDDARVFILQFNKSQNET